MNILYHHRTQGRGVEGVHIRSIVKALRDLDHNVCIISPPGCDPFSDEAKTSNTSPGFIRTFFSLLSRYCPEFAFECVELAYNITAFLKISREVKKRNIDLIYERYFLFSLASNLISRKYQIPIIYEVNDSSFVVRLRRLRFVKIANFFEKKVFSKADCLIVVSHHFKNHLVKAGISEEKLIVSHNAIDPNLFNPDNIKAIELGTASDCLIIGFVGLFVKWVCLESLLQHFSKIHSEYSKTHLLLVGSGPEERNLREMITDLGLQSHVTITGKVPHEQVPSYIHRMDICVIPKHERYTSPVKLFEYMAMKKVVLVPALEAIEEVIQHGKNGILFDPDNEDHFPTTLKGLIENKESLKLLGENARAEVLEKYTWRKNALQIEEILKHIRRSPLIKKKQLMLHNCQKSIHYLGNFFLTLQFFPTPYPIS